MRGWLDPSLAIAHRQVRTDGSRQAPIRNDLLAMAEELPQPKSFDPTPGQAAAQSAGADDPGAPEDEKGKDKLLGGQAKVPKWLQKVAKK